jgi:threonine dehydrogenase-like Zn-dependent dehydrogenase
VAVVGPGTLGLLSVLWSRLAEADRIVVIGLDRATEATARGLGATDFFTAGEHPAARVRDLTGGGGADVVFETAGHEDAVALSLDLARRGGAVALLGIAGAGRPAGFEADVFALKDLRVYGSFAYTSDDFAAALRLIESGRANVKPLITHAFPLPEFEKAFQLLSERTEPVVKALLRP